MIAASLQRFLCAYGRGVFPDFDGFSVADTAGVALVSVSVRLQGDA